MPRTKSIIRKRFSESTEVLCSEIEETLVFGRGVIGVAIELRSLDDWKRYWSRWRDTIMPKALEALPGRRPFACYVVGEIPPRPIVMEPPLSNGYFKHYVPGSNGTGQWHYLMPEPFQQDEANYLHDLGLIDADEMTPLASTCARWACIIESPHRRQRQPTSARRAAGGLRTWQTPPEPRASRSRHRSRSRSTRSPTSG
jgi:hypothetical protein